MKLPCLLPAEIDRRNILETFLETWRGSEGRAISFRLRRRHPLSSLVLSVYRAEKKSLQILLSSTQAGPGRKVKQEQEEISRNHVPRLFLGSVQPRI